MLAIQPRVTTGPHRQLFHLLQWKIARGRWRGVVAQVCETDADLGAVLLDLGFAGSMDAMEAIGMSADVEIRSYGDRSYVRVADTRPLTT